MLDVLHSPKVRKKFNFFSLFYILDQTCFSHLRRKAKTHLCSSASKLESQWGSLLSLAWLPVLPTHSGAGRSSQSIGLLCLRKGEMLTRLHSQMNNYIYIVICRCSFFYFLWRFGSKVKYVCDTALYRYTLCVCVCFPGCTICIHFSFSGLLMCTGMTLASRVLSWWKKKSWTWSITSSVTLRLAAGRWGNRAKFTLPPPMSVFVHHRVNTVCWHLDILTYFLHFGLGLSIIVYPYNCAPDHHHWWG